MLKTFSITLILLFLPCLFFVPQAASQEPTEKPFEEFTSYELFWPIVAGKVPGDSLYTLKELKWKLKGLIIFSDLRKADYHLTLSKKRVVETEKLLIEKQDYNRAATTAQKSLEELQKAISLAEKIKAKGNKTTNIHSAILTNGANELNFLRFLIIQIPEDKKSPFTQTTDSMDNLLQKFGAL